jgi:hypothetical protein
MNKKIVSIFALSIALISSSLCTTALVSAADAGTVTSLVQCGRIGEHACGYNDLIVGLQTAIDFVIKYVIIPLMVLVILRAGVLLVISGDKASAKTQAKKALQKAFIGLFFILTAWLIVDSLISFFGVD